MLLTYFEGKCEILFSFGGSIYFSDTGIKLYSSSYCPMLGGKVTYTSFTKRYKCVFFGRGPSVEIKYICPPPYGRNHPPLLFKDLYPRRVSIAVFLRRKKTETGLTYRNITFRVFNIFWIGLKILILKILKTREAVLQNVS